ncbi:MAG: phosphoribosylamine--glycine ligase [Candidatus Dormibacteria bacterium]
MRVLIAGSGGREHALAWACTQGHPEVEVVCAPGNGGTAAFARNLAVAADDPAGVVGAARDCEARLVVVGPDAAVAAGVADACRAAGIAVFGPSAAAARIESSKSFAKSLMDAAGIPTARWCSGTAGDRSALLAMIDELGGRCVVKADGLALGKGVVVCDDAATARRAVAACLDEGAFGSAGTPVLVEERLEGAELSVFALTDATSIRLLPPARDHKRIGDGDSGPNTGGMGAVTPPQGIDDALLQRVEREVLRPCVDALAERGTPFAGCLYAGLMLTANGLRVLEFNARFGDPETQVLLPVLDEDVLGLLTDCAAGTLSPGSARRAADGCAAGVVLAAAGYPGTPRRGDVISGLDALDPAVLAFHGGTRCDLDGTLRTDGGRVLTLVARGRSLEAARRHVYASLPAVHFESMQHRTDIGAAPTGDT